MKEVSTVNSFLSQEMKVLGIYWVWMLQGTRFQVRHQMKLQCMLACTHTAQWHIHTHMNTLTHVYSYTVAHTHACKHICIETHTCLHTSTHVRACVHAHTHTGSRTHTCRLTHMQAHTHTHQHMHAHWHTHTHAHTPHTHTPMHPPPTHTHTRNNGVVNNSSLEVHDSTVHSNQWGVSIGIDTNSRPLCPQHPPYHNWHHGAGHSWTEGNMNVMYTIQSKPKVPVYITPKKEEKSNRSITIEKKHKNL